ncbi:MAG TPA: FAD-dependent tricarballylate dehydrogenase TcuA, partial [Bradyrhizobium sp.]
MSEAGKISDVLVIGGGCAALCAAIAARRSGASVRMVEQAPLALRGGNARHARNFRLMHDQPTWYVPDVYGEDAFFKDLLRVTHGATDERLARILIRGSAAIAPWLGDNGVRLQDPSSGAMPYSRRTAFFLGGGKAAINALYTTAIKLGVCVGYDNEVVALTFGGKGNCTADIRRDGRIERAVAKTIVVCSGGHQANLGWLRESFGPAADHFMIRGTPYDTGSVLRLLLDAGAKPVGDPARAHMVAVDARGPKFDGGIVTRITAIPHGIVVDRHGKRFHDEGEDARKTHFARWGARIAEREGQIAYLILDAKGFGRALPTALAPIRADTIAALASALGLDPAALETTLREFNAATATDDVPLNER